MKPNPREQDRQVSLKSSLLNGRRIGVGVCAAIGAVEVVKIIRELRRHGAEVTAFLSPDSKKFVGPLALEWACGRPVVAKLTAELAHLDTFDLVLVCPASLNTLAKSVIGMADNPVTCLIASQLGGQGRLLFVPTMNLALQKHPSYESHLTQLKSWGAVIFNSPVEEGRLKVPDPESLAKFVCELFS